MTHATCCDKPHYAKGLCRSHYRKQEPRIKVNVPCATCGQTCTKYRDDTRQRASYCSYQCRADGQFGTNRAGRKSKALVYVGPASPPPPPQHEQPTPPRVWVAGACAWCERSFVQRVRGSHARFCTAKCKSKYHTSSFGISPHVRLAIYARDEWTCQLCGGVVDATLDHEHPKSATLDHIRCQSWGQPDHSPTNLRLAHRICNSIRSDESRDWRAMLTERGLLAVS